MKMNHLFIGVIACFIKVRFGNVGIISDDQRRKIVISPVLNFQTHWYMLVLGESDRVQSL